MYTIYLGEEDNSKLISGKAMDCTSLKKISAALERA